jgi:ATP-dependent DNA helicase DinG
VQGELPKGEIAKRFRADGNAVLFATKSFWEGVSIEGEALRLVVIDKLPFAAPSPLSKARETTVKNPFMDLQVPEMIIDLKQGCGRLIRNMTDWGALAILDPRVRLKPYGRTQVVPALPPAKYTHRMGEVEEFFHQRRTASVITSPKDVTMGVPYYLEELEELGF